MTTAGREEETEEEATLSPVELAKQSGVPIRLVVEYTKKYEGQISHTIEEGHVWYFPRAVVEVQRLRREERARKQVTVEFPEPDSSQRALAEIGAIKDALTALRQRLSEAEKLLRAERSPVMPA